MRATAASHDPRRCCASRCARSNGLPHDQRAGDGGSADPTAGREGRTRPRIRAEPRRPGPDHGTNGQRGGHRARYHQPALCVLGAVGGAIGPRRGAAGAPRRHGGASVRGSASGADPLPRSRRIRGGRSEAPAPRAQRTGLHSAVFVNRPVREHASVLLRTAPAVVEVLGISRPWDTRRWRTRGTSRIVGGGGACTAVRRTSASDGDAGGGAGSGGADLRGRRCHRRRCCRAAAQRPSSPSTTRWRSVSSPALDQARDVRTRRRERGGVRRRTDGRHGGAPLTTISMPTTEAGAIAVAMLHEGPARRELVAQLVIRHSTGPVRRGRASAAAARARPIWAAGRG